MKRIEEALEGVRSVAIAGHVDPDGDCIGSTMALYLYITENYPDIRTTVYLEHYKPNFAFIKGLDRSRPELDASEEVDLLILADISSISRIGVAGPLVDRTEKILCFDHHKTNTADFTWMHNHPDLCSTCEVVFGYLDAEKISEHCAEALYMGLIHDSGLFRYESTSPETMEMAAFLMRKGIPFNRIVDNTFDQRTYDENRIIGKVLMESRLYADEKIVAASVTKEEMDEYGVKPENLDAVVSELRKTAGVEVAVFIYWKQPGIWKVSMRSKSQFDVSRVAVHFGGGGHIRAAGCNLRGPLEEIRTMVLREIEAHL